MRSYGITTADRNTIKKIAGKIIPAISTTTAFVTGAIAVELYKVEQGLTKLEDYRSCFANLSMPMFCFTEPGACAKTPRAVSDSPIRPCGTSTRCCTAR